ncbi:hypothetical protein BJY16_003113 [Actinoplanes octamycinicus]|uniref:TY-Chap N-terminal domain-containing protein n=1 Tax=Actinoplanes octamycinicus TaxID=135948 RepID=A0A7W7M7B2_9ACTN|nr:hypothetical protein [Actinoplanes octamycinicus]MBB4739654.1 hypothetical protein [Actinoplanes octamycinicus]GIE54837.1 hypothetical protein Aoc01nite_02390 [Actinoplanes octamycinicus]
MSADGWDRLAAEIAGMVPSLADGDTLIVRARPYFVQMQQLPDHLQVEAIADEFLPEDRRLTARDRQHMVELGWRPPPEPELGDNWECPFPWPLSSADAARVGELFVRTLREVHGATDPAGLVRESFNALGGRG